MFGGRRETSILKHGRESCYQARDAFHACVEKQGVQWQVGSPVPKECKATRKEYEKLCRAAWVKHFDRLRDKEVQIAKVLATNINASTPTAFGVQAGKQL